MRIIDRLARWLSSYKRMSEAECYGVPFRMRMWYNYRLYIAKEDLPYREYIEIFDGNGKYIKCPAIGGKVVVVSNGKRYNYTIIGFRNDSSISDWMNAYDWIDPIVEYDSKCNEGE